jgi:hypothetical protein
MIVLLTLGVAYIWLGNPNRSQSAYNPARADERGRTLGSLWGSKGECPPQTVSFEETVKKVGFVRKPGSTESDNEQFAHLNTKMLGHTPGWTIFEQIYLFNGQLYVVTCVLGVFALTAGLTAPTGPNCACSHRLVLAPTVTPATRRRVSLQAGRSSSSRPTRRIDSGATTCTACAA